MDLGFELQGNFNVVFVNEFHEAFNKIYRYARQHMGINNPRYGHHVEDITEYIDGQHEDKLRRLIGWVDESKTEELTGFIGGPPCPDFSVAGKTEDVMAKTESCQELTLNLFAKPCLISFCLRM